MAINYLNSIDLNKNELLQGVIENQPNDAAVGSSPVTGQIYYNTTDSELRQYNGTDWVSVGDITGLAEGLYIDIDDAGGPIPTIKHELTTRTDTTSTGSPGYAGTFTVVDSVTTNTTGHITALNVKTVTMPASDNTNTTYDLDKAAGSANLILAADGTNQDSIEFAGTANEIEIDVATEDVYTFKFPDAGVVLPNGSTAYTQATGDNSTKVATTAFVQASVTGLLEFKGGFDADTGTIVGGTTNLTKNNQPNTGDQRVAVAVGDYYVVTADGDFFGNANTPLTVGDSVIVQTAAAAGASTEADFIVVQSDTDLATASTVGLGNVVPGTSATITAPYSAGTSTLDVVDSTAAQKGAVIVAGGTGISVGYASGTATITNTQNNSDNTATGTITAGNLSGTVTHTFGINTIVQTIDSSGDTVYCDISRTATTSVATIAAVEATDITILVQKIG